MRKYDGCAIVTGGSRGIGSAFCDGLAKDGYNLVIGYVSESSAERADALAKKLESQYGIKSITAQGDISKYEDCTAIAKKACDAFDGKIGVLVNNAGMESGGPFVEHTQEEYTRMINVDLMGTMHMIHNVLPVMIDQGYGAIVNITSTAGITGWENQVDYSAAKHGVNGVTRALAKEVGKYGITVNAIAPGVIMTDMLRQQPPEITENGKKISPLGLIGSTEEMAECLNYVVGAEFLTGQVISPNGGITI